MLVSVNQNINLGVSVGVGLVSVAGLGFVWKLYKLWKSEQPPSKWRKVGELSDLMCFPMKSAGVIRLEEMDCTIIGVQTGYLRDRVFMCVTLDQRYVTSKTHPKMLFIQPHIEESIMTLSAPGMPDIKIDMSELGTQPLNKVEVWRLTIDSVDCGDEIAIWLSKYLLGEETGMRMVYYPLNIAKRSVTGNGDLGPVKEYDGGALHYESSYNLMCESSLEDLNTRLQDPVTAQQFRPNFVVKGSQPFEEDDWKWVRIGDTTFRNVLPCGRCLLTTVDPKTGIKHDEVEPLKTLRKYRVFPKISRDPILGIHLALRSGGRIKMGDPVYVEAY